MVRIKRIYKAKMGRVRITPYLLGAINILFCTIFVLLVFRLWDSSIRFRNSNESHRTLILTVGDFRPIQRSIVMVKLLDLIDND